MPNAVSRLNDIDDQSDCNSEADNAVAGLLQDERRPAKQIVRRSESNGRPNSKPIALVDDASQRFQRCCIALRLLSDAYDYALQLGRLCWDFAEEIDSLRLHGLTNGDLRWLVCSGFVEHGREITELGQERRKFHRERRLCFLSDTCFVLTEKGASYARNCLNASAKVDATQRMQVDSDEGDDPDVLPNPTWDCLRQELRVGKTIVKQFKVPAPNQETILAVFQEEDWPVYIDDPLPRDPEIDPKRRLHDTIGSLNRSQKNHLIQFRGNGSGEGILWELIPHSESLKKPFASATHDAI